MTRILSTAFGAFLLLSLGTKSGAAEPTKAGHPNVMIILADDLGYGSLNSYGADDSHIRTPNLDRLAKEGRRFTDANTPSSVCSPTRYGLLTGRYDWRTNQKHGVVNTTDPLHIDVSSSTVASVLKSAGYRTAAIGKWHLGYGSEKQVDFTKPLTPGPLDLGFDYHFAVPQNHGDASGVYIHFPYTPSATAKGTSGTGLYGDWVHELDLSIGRLLDSLDRLKVTEETLVIFTSDNGGVLMTEGQRPEAEAFRAGLRPNGNWRGRKHSIYEGGFRVPFLVRWPGHVEPGAVCDETINLVDIYATFATLIDQPVSPNEDAAEDSFNVLPALLGLPHEEPLRPSMIVHSPNGNYAIRSGPWKYVEGIPSPTLKRVPQQDELHAQLYNLQDDSGEQNKVIKEHPDVVQRLASLLEKQRADRKPSTLVPQQEIFK